MMLYEKAKIGEGIYTISDLSYILGIPKRRSRYWFNTYIREALPLISNYRYNMDPEKGLFVNFKSLIQLYVFEELINRGFTKKKILKAYKALGNHYDTKYPFALKNIYTSGSDIVFDEKTKIISADGKFQFNLDLIRPFMDKIKFDDLGNANQFYPKGFKSSIVVDPKIQFGTPTIKGTRIDIKTISDLFEAGDSKELISRVYGLTNIQVSEAIGFSKAA